MERDWEQTWQGGSGGWIRHRAFGTALEHPVPRNTSDDEEGGGASAAAWPLGTASAAIGFAGASPLLETARGRGEAGDGGGANRTTGSVGGDARNLFGRWFCRWENWSCIIHHHICKIPLKNDSSIKYH